MISKCPTYLTYRIREPSETPIKPEIADHPCTRCAVDLFLLQLLFVNCRLLFKAYCSRKFTEPSI